MSYYCCRRFYSARRRIFRSVYFIFFFRSVGYRLHSARDVSPTRTWSIFFFFFFIPIIIMYSSVRRQRFSYSFLFFRNMVKIKNHIFICSVLDLHTHTHTNNTIEFCTQITKTYSTVNCISRPEKKSLRVA